MKWKIAINGEKTTRFHFKSSNLQTPANSHNGRSKVPWINEIVLVSPSTRGANATQSQSYPSKTTRSSEDRANSTSKTTLNESIWWFCQYRRVYRLLGGTSSRPASWSSSNRKACSYGTPQMHHEMPATTTLSRKTQSPLARPCRLRGEVQRQI